MPKPDLIHVIFNGGQNDESQGIASLRQKRWLTYTWGRFSGHHANGEAGVLTVAIADSDFKLLLSREDDPNGYHELANWDHVAELLNCPAFELGNRLGGEVTAPIELLVVVRGKATGQQISELERIIGHRASDVSSISGNTDVLFHVRTEANAAKLSAKIGAKIEKLEFVEAIAIDRPRR